MPRTEHAAILAEGVRDAVAPTAAGVLHSGPLAKTSDALPAAP